MLHVLSGPSSYFFVYCSVYLVHCVLSALLACSYVFRCFYSHAALATGAFQVLRYKFLRAVLAFGAPQMLVMACLC